jgi:polyisoprenoid-binding protein YceI
VPHFDASSAECLVLTYKEGLLSAVAHDLQIRVTRFDLDVEASPPSVRARLDATSLRVDGARHGGALDVDTLSDADRQKIEHNIVADVLEAARSADIVFTSTAVTPEGEGYRVSGDLTLHGRTRPLSFVARPEGDRLVAEVRIHQPDFGIKPYQAMLGTLKVKPDVTVQASVPRQAIGP